MAVHEDERGYSIRNRQSDLVIDIPGGRPDRGLQIEQFPDKRAVSQLWSFFGSDEAGYAIYSQHTDKVLTASLRGATLDGAPVVQWEWARRREQRWKLEEVAKITESEPFSAE